ncbi:hypothetical protein AAG906_020000 [Vitis piasezkii]
MTPSPRGLLLMDKKVNGMSGFGKRTVGKVATQEEDDVILDNKATTEEKEPLKRPC